MMRRQKRDGSAAGADRRHGAAAQPPIRGTDLPLYRLASRRRPHPPFFCPGSSRLPDGQTRNKLFNRTDPPFSKRSLPANQLPDVADKALRFAGGGFGDITDGDKEEEGDGK